MKKKARQKKKQKKWKKKKKTMLKMMILKMNQLWYIDIRFNVYRNLRKKVENLIQAEKWKNQMKMISKKMNQ